MTEHELTSLTDYALTVDGGAIDFTMQASSGPIARLRVTLDDMPEHIMNLCQMVAAVHPSPRPSSGFVPIAVAGLGLASTDDAAVTLLVLRLAGMDLAFSLSSTQVAALGREFDRMAQTLSAHGPHRH